MLCRLRLDLQVSWAFFGNMRADVHRPRSNVARQQLSGLDLLPLMPTENTHEKLILNRHELS